jgi:hypothetical protein
VGNEESGAQFDPASAATRAGPADRRAPISALVSGRGPIKMATHSNNPAAVVITCAPQS